MNDQTIWVEVPVTVRVTNYRPAVPARIVNSWHDSDPAEPAEYDTELLINGEPAEWIRQHITDGDWHYLDQLLEEGS